VFAQVIEGRTTNASGIRSALERWVRDAAPGAVGWAGTTAGVTYAGRFVAVLRFDTEQAARANESRPEHHQWWTETSALLGGHVAVRNGTVVGGYFAGDSAQAGFVQVVQGRVSNLDGAREHVRRLQDALKVHLPALLSIVTVEHGDGWFTRALHYSSEAEARAGERDMPPEVRRLDREALRLVVGPLEFLDLREPWVHLAARPES
jgi:hypothetical protein